MNIKIKYLTKIRGKLEKSILETKEED